MEQFLAIPGAGKRLDPRLMGALVAPFAYPDICLLQPVTSTGREGFHTAPRRSKP